MAAGSPPMPLRWRYIANADDNTLSLIDTDTNEVVKTIFNLPHRFT
jgi:DNA-binding beta-propeller fold protein YncE